MPQAYPAIAAWAAKTFTWKAVGTFLLKTALLTAASYGVSRLLAKKQAGLNGSTGGSKLDPSRDINQPHRIIYGRDRVSHLIRLRHKAGVGGRYLYYIAVWAGHECDAIEKEFLGEDELTFDGAGYATGKYAGHIRRAHHLGAWDQTADADFVAEIGSVWTANHRLRGRCFTAYRFDWDANKFAGGLQNLTAVIRGRKVYDPRDEDHDIEDPSTWTWSANPVLCEADYLRGVPYYNADQEIVRRFGLKMADDRINWTVATASANACDEAIPLAGGGAEPRYELHFSFYCDSPHPDVLATMESSMDGRSLFIGGEAHIRPGVWNAPDFDITEDMLRRGSRRTRHPLSRREKFNRISGTFNNPAENFKRTPTPPVISDTYKIADGGELAREMDLPGTASVTMAQRILRQKMLRSRHGTMYQFPANLRALPALTGETVRITRASLGWTNKAFELLELNFKVERGDRGGLGFALDLTGQATAASIYDWTTSLEGTIPSPGSAVLYDPSVVETPTGLSLSTSNFVQRDGTITPRLKAEFAAPTDRFILSGGHGEMEFKKSADAAWLPWNAKIRPDAGVEFITDVRASDGYDVRMRWVNAQNYAGDWCTPESHTVSTDTTVPAAPTGLAAIATAGSITVDWDNSPEHDLKGYRLYRNIVNDASTAALIWEGAASAYPDLKAPAGMASYYWVTAIDTSDNESPDSLVATATPNPATGNKFVYVFKTAVSLPATPTGNGIPSGWSATPTGNPQYVSGAEQTSTGTLVGAWSTPIRLNGSDGANGADGADGADGASGDGISVEYSVDGASGWHGTFAPGDFYLRIQVGSGGWGSAIKISGEISDGEITTIMMENEAVTTASSSYTDGAATFTTSWNTLQSINLTTDAGVVNLWGTFFTTNGGGIYMKLRFVRDGSVIWTSPQYGQYAGPHGSWFSDVPGAGNHDYDLQAYTAAGTPNAYARMLMAVNFKR